MCEDCSLIKVDLLCIDALDKMQAELELLLENNVIEWQGSLKATYEKYIGVYTLERNAKDMWEMLWNHKVMSFFQMEKESGVQAVALAKPASVDELATINSVLRLMAQEKGAETPLQKYARFRENIQYWYDEMTEYGLTQEEQDILKDIIGVSFGICEAQEYLVLLTMHPKIGGFSLAWGDRLRKAVAKKKPKETGTIDDIEYRCPFQENKLTYDDSIAPCYNHYYDVPECNVVALMTKANIVQIGQNTVIIVKNGKEKNNEIQGWRQSKN